VAKIPIFQGALNLVTDQLHWVNAEFAVFVMTSFLERSGVSGYLGRHLKYWFAFRDERGETLSLIAYCCEQMSKRPREVLDGDAEAVVAGSS